MSFAARASQLQATAGAGESQLDDAMEKRAELEKQILVIERVKMQKETEFKSWPTRTCVI